ncbi:MAG: metalloregulator ArsR/SmtB family transcription factor [Bacteroidota bacterium]|nr:metalloregulator ArsR/SmtB family transcription factor [Bacteroidota bacterium]
MVCAKRELFDDELQVCAEYFKVLAHPARLKILKYLSECKTCISGDISDELPLSRTTVNQHLNELKKIGLIKGHFEGVKKNYCLDYFKVEEMKRLTGLYLSEIEMKEDFKCE